MFQLKEKFSDQSILSKVILAVLFGALVVFFSWGISRVLFRKTFLTIHELSQPNQKLSLVNNLFQKVSHLDPMQNVQELKDYRDFLPQSLMIMRTLDSLKTLCRSNTQQIKRIEYMKELLKNRELLFNAYLKYRKDVIYNKSLSKKIKILSSYIRDHINDTDSSVVTKEEKTTTTVINESLLSKKGKQSFFKRLFGKKKNNKMILTPKSITTEDVKITVDTISVAQRDEFIQTIEAAIRAIDKDGRGNVSELLEKEMELYTTGNAFINELQKLLHEIQDEEYTAMQNNTQLLGMEFNKATVRIAAMLLLFLLIVAILIYLIFSDISKSNKYKMQLVEAKERAEESERVKQRFLANMSHELRTPLQSIIGFSEQLRTENSQDKKSIDIIHSSSEYLLQIVNEVLDYSRIVSGKFAIEKRDFNMNELIAEVAETMDLQAENKNLRFIFKADVGQTSWYSGDDFRLKQILYNLLSNAIKFTNAGEVNFFISNKELDHNTSEFCFEIKDTGIGIEQEKLEKVFNPFEQASGDTQRLYGGTGLGLGIAKALTEIQGGKLDVESEKEKGSCFRVNLSYQKSEQQNQEDDLEFSDQEFSGKILVVDDDAFIVQLCTTVLDKHNIKYQSFSSSLEALKMSWDNSVSLVLLDIRMPEMSGIELCRRLKKIAPPHIRFVALTAQAFPEEGNTILQQGFSEILLKPFREKDLLNVIYNKKSVEQNKKRIDLKAIEALCMNDPVLISKTLGVFIRETLIDLNFFRKSVDDKNRKAVSEVVHRLSAKTGQAGAVSLSLKLKFLEKQSQREFNFGNEALLEIFEEIEQVIEGVKYYKIQFDSKPQSRT